MLFANKELFASKELSANKGLFANNELSANKEQRRLAFHVLDSFATHSGPVQFNGATDKK